MFFEINSHTDYLKVCAFFGAMVYGVMWVLNGPVVHEPAVKKIIGGQEQIIVQAEKYKSHYQLEKRVNEPFLITAIYPQRSRSNPFADHHSQFVTFSPDATRLYMKKYAGMTHCPASFLNKHADHISLYAANSKIAEKLSNWKQKNGSHVKRWQVVNIIGQCLGKRSKIEKDEIDVTKSTRQIVIGRKASRDCHMIYVTDIEQTDNSIQDYIKG